MRVAVQFVESSFVQPPFSLFEALERTGTLSTKFFHDSECVRFEKIERVSNEEWNVELSVVHYYDFLRTNYQLKNCMGDEVPVLLLEEVIDEKELASPIAVSVLFKDPSGACMIAHRNAKECFVTAEYSALVTGSLEYADFVTLTEQDFSGGAQREILTELGLTRGEDYSLRFTGIYVAPEKCQPVLLFTAELVQPVENYIGRMLHAPEFKLENTKVFKIDPSNAAVLAGTNGMSKTLRYQLRQEAIMEPVSSMVFARVL